MVEQPLSHEGEEEFFDVPDAVDGLSVASRQPTEVTLQWQAPCDNARAIQRYQLYLQHWSLESACGPLPAQSADGLEGHSAASKDILLVHATASEVAAEHAGPGVCQLTTRAPATILLNSHAELDVSGALASEGLPDAAWASVRAGNCEGWAEWAAPVLVLFRKGCIAPAGSILQTWGLAEDGRLGRGHAALERKVCAEAGAVEALSGQGLQALALGSHSAAITADDRLFVWGTFLAEAGEAAPHLAGSGSAHDEVNVHVEPAKQQLPVVPHSVACGRFATAVLSADGRVFAWGPNEAYQCGIKGPPVLRVLTELRLPQRALVVRLALGEFHGLALTAAGTALVWGMEQGPEISMRPGCDLGPKLGVLPERAALNQPEPRELDMPARVTGISAGAYHSALITEDGRLWLWGSNDQGQLGHGRDVRELRTPRPVEAFGGNKGRRVALVSLGGFHSAAVDTDGQLFTWGDNKRGQCGQGEVATVEKPLELTLAPSETRCVGIACGGFFSLFEGQASRIYACGWGKEGCLGFGQACKRMLRPRPVPTAPCGHRWALLRTGMVHVAGLLAEE